MEWIRIKSWHIVRTWTRGGGVLTLCGRYVHPGGDALVTWRIRPEGPTCESCLRIEVPRDE